ncbi:hypothetical protein COT95_01420 [Candidatus Falkowbacteria bacterium CG10_big_fil_rev_8_21_14_0_10_37_6]|uniref:Glycosyltransferase family 4 protein n=1 Tax=Candidatus Falkowbacteria bacterium CG10_big_fil_rev_8_21_14_0_10_37_6 TaxID=1974563 RepID=A0A2H0V782_9BACT|nr:MAG: hypothetical protein COT95_01420 [Candidatus Falkowbacteria bacterium CG10_big_fil_rev_8_21_14_0_10_37_6]
MSAVKLLKWKNKTMKVAIFADNFYPELSGITDSLLLFGRQMAAQGHKIMFVAPYYARRDYNAEQKIIFEKNLHSNISILRLPSIRYPNSLTGQSRIVLPCGLSILPLKNFKPDIIHANSPFGAGLEALLASKVLAVPLVGTNHTPISEFVSSRFLKIVSLRYFIWYYNHCKIITAPCRSLLKEMVKYGFVREKKVLPNPVDLVHFYPLRDGMQKNQYKNDFGLSSFTVLYTGRIANEKHIDIIIKAIAKVKQVIPNISFAIAGHGQSESELKVLVKKLKLQDNVKFFGILASDAFLKLYQASDLFVIMSVAESQSLSLMQAMACGLPVIGAKARALPEYITKQNGLLVAPGDIASLAEKIIYIFQNNQQAVKFGQNGIIDVQQYFVSAIAKKWEKLYVDVIKNYDKKN